MPDFSKAKIYKLVSNKSSDVYIGSCLVELSKRLSVHKAPSNLCVSKTMFIDDAVITIVLIENYPCLCKNEMKARELHYITTLQCININKPFISDIQIINGDDKEWRKQYRLNHVEEYKQYYKQYRLTHAEEYKQYDKQYNITHAEEQKQYNKQYYLDHIEQKKQRDKQYYLNKKLKAQQQQLSTNTNINCINNIIN